MAGTGYQVGQQAIVIPVGATDFTILKKIAWQAL